MSDEFQQLVARMDHLTQAIGHLAQNQAQQPAAAGPRGRGPQAPIFRGTSSEHVDNFVFKLTNYLDFNAIQDPARRLLLAINCLEDHALIWFRSLAQPPQDLAQLTALMQQTFRDVDEQRQLRQELRRLRQQTSVQDYVHHFRELMVRIQDMALLDRIEAFILGLKPKTRNEVAFHAPETLEDAYRLALRYDRNYQPAFGAFTTARSAWQQPRYNAPTPMDVDAVNTRHQPPLRRLTDQEREELRRQRACFRCRQPGHIARECPLNNRAAQPSSSSAAAPKNDQRQ